MVERKPAREAGGASVCAGLSARVRLGLALALIASFGAFVAACGGDGERLGERVIPLGQPVPKGGGVYMLGKPYQVGGMWYTPRDEPGYNRVGRASWYGELFHGRRTANGEIYDMDRLSAASPTLPLPVYAQVTNLTNGRSIVVRVNDRGPYANDRIMDLSRRSAEVLGFQSDGTALVRVKYLGRAPINGDDRYEQKFLASQSWMQVAAKGRSGKGKRQATDIASLPPENPENLQTPWKEAAPVQSAAATPCACTARCRHLLWLDDSLSAEGGGSRPARRPALLAGKPAGRREAASRGHGLAPATGQAEPTDRWLFDPGRLVQEPGKRR